MGRWGDAANKAQGPSDYIKMQDGDEITIRVLTDPVVQNKTFPSDPDNPRTQFSWVVWDYDNQAPKILSQSPGFAKKLDFISEKWGDKIPMDCDIVIKRNGSGLQTTYDLTAVPATVPLTPDWELRVKSIDLNKALPGHIPIKDFLESDTKPQSFPEAAPAPATTPAPTPVPKEVDKVFDIEDGPINLDDIPF
jgi:hypothetical protein